MTTLIKTFLMKFPILLTTLLLFLTIQNILAQRLLRECGIDPSTNPVRFVNASVDFDTQSSSYIVTAFGYSSSPLSNAKIYTSVGLLGLSLSSDQPPYASACSFIQGGCQNVAAGGNFTLVKPIKLPYQLVLTETDLSINLVDDSGSAAKDIGCMIVSTDLPRNTLIHQILFYVPLVVCLIAGLATLSRHWTRINFSVFALSSGFYPIKDIVLPVRYGFGFLEMARFVQFVGITSALSIPCPGFYRHFGTTMMWFVPLWPLKQIRSWWTSSADLSSREITILQDEGYGLYQTAGYLELNPDTLFMNALFAFLALFILLVVWTMLIHLTWWLIASKKKKSIDVWTSLNYLHGNFHRLASLVGPGISTMAFFTLSLSVPVWLKVLSVLTVIVTQILPIVIISYILFKLPEGTSLYSSDAASPAIGVGSKRALYYAVYTNAYKDTRKFWGIIDAVRNLILAILVGTATDFPLVQAISLLVLEFAYSVAQIIRKPFIKNAGSRLTMSVVRLAIVASLTAMLIKVEMIRILQAYVSIGVVVLIFIISLMISFHRIIRSLMWWRWRKEVPKKMPRIPTINNAARPPTVMGEVPAPRGDDDEVMVVQPLSRNNSTIGSVAPTTSSGQNNSVDILMEPIRGDLERDDSIWIGKRPSSQFQIDQVFGQPILSSSEKRKSDVPSATEKAENTKRSSMGTTTSAPGNLERGDVREVAKENQANHQSCLVM